LERKIETRGMFARFTSLKDLRGARCNPKSASGMQQGRRVVEDENRRGGEKLRGRNVLGEVDPGEAGFHDLER
jgi:hypothetical protein